VKRILCVLFAAMLVLLCGCSAMLEKEYLSITDYDLSGSLPDEPEIGAISSYDALIDALENMVNKHQESAQLQFNNYAGNISDDLAEAGWQLKQNSALGAYMVDYISYDISRIVTYYQATVYINYTHSQQEMDEIINLGANRIDSTVVDSVSAGENKLVMRIYASSIDGEDMAERIESSLLSAPQKVPVIPNVEVTVYSGSDSQDIFDVRFDYRSTDRELKLLGEELLKAVADVSESITAEDEYSVAILAADRVGELCDYDAAQSLSTAYDVLINGVGDSRAVSMAYSAVCAEKGVESRIVSGLKNNEQYYWCMVKIGDFWYHADVAEAMEYSSDTVFLFNDGEVIRSFRWNELEYPACSGPSLIPAPEAPPQTPAPEETEKIEEN